MLSLTYTGHTLNFVQAAQRSENWINHRLYGVQFSPEESSIKSTKDYTKEMIMDFQITQFSSAQEQSNMIWEI